MSQFGACVPRSFVVLPHETQANLPIRTAAAGLTLQEYDSAHRLALDNSKKWLSSFFPLRCRFLDGTQRQRMLVQQHARTWEQHCAARFAFGSFRDAEIRISFGADGTSWSAVGTDALNNSWFPHYQPTVNFGWLHDESDLVEWQRVVLHEFGHVLGAVHEHQSPAMAPEWDYERVYTYFKGPPNYWTVEEIDENIIRKFSVGQVNASAFDPSSIMLYVFPKELLLNCSTSNNTTLSNGDKEFIRAMYP